MGNVILWGGEITCGGGDKACRDGEIYLGRAQMGTGTGLSLGVTLYNTILVHNQSEEH